MIGILDWGIGGLSVTRHFTPKEQRFLYLSDSGFTPYGKVPTNILRNRLDHLTNWMFEQGVEKILVACHSASTAYEESARISLINTHGVKAIPTQGVNRIGVIGGVRTIRSQWYRKALEAQGLSVQQRIAQPLSAFIEAGKFSSDLEVTIQKIVRPLADQDVMLLACTHYPAATAQIAAALEWDDSRIIDPALTAVKWMREQWTEYLLPGTPVYYTTGNCKEMQVSADRAFNIQLAPLPIQS